MRGHGITPFQNFRPLNNSFIYPGITYPDLEAEIQLLAISSGNNYNYGITVNNSFGTSIISLGNSISILDTTVSNDIHNLAISTSNTDILIATSINTLDQEFNLIVGPTTSNILSQIVALGSSISMSDNTLSTDIHNTSIALGNTTNSLAISLSILDNTLSNGLNSTNIALGNTTTSLAISLSMSDNTLSNSINNTNIALGNTTNSIGISIVSLDSSVNGLIDALGVSSINEDAEIGSLYSAFLTVSGAVSDVNSFAHTVKDTVDTIQTALEILDSAFTAADLLFTAFDTQQAILNAGYQVSIDALESSVATLEEDTTVIMGTSIPNIEFDIGTLGHIVTDLGVSIEAIDAHVGTSGLGFQTVINSHGVSIATIQNTQQNLIGVSVFNIDVWKSGIITQTLPGIGTSIQNVDSKESLFGTTINALAISGINTDNHISLFLGTSFINLSSTVNNLTVSGINTDNRISLFLGTSFINLSSTVNNLTVSGINTDSRISLFLGTTLPLMNTTINSLGISIQGLNNSHSAFGISIASLGSSLTILDSVLSNSIAFLTTTSNSLGVSLVSLDTVLSNNISFLTTTGNSLGSSIVSLNNSTGTLLANLGTTTVSISTSTSALESNKADKLLISTSISNVNVKDSIMFGVSFPNYGTSIANEETNKMDKLLVGVSITNVNTFASNLSPSVSLLGTSISNDDSKIGILIGVSFPKLLTNTDIALPSSFVSSSLSSLGTITSLSATRGAFGRTHGGQTTVEIKANQGGAGALSLLPKVDNGENTIYFQTSAFTAGYFSGTTGTWLIGNNITGNDSNSFSIWNPNLSTKNFILDISGNATLSNNLTVNGTFSSPLTTTIGTSISRLLTNTDITLPTSYKSSSLTSLGRISEPLSIQNTMDSIGTLNLSVSGSKIVSLSLTPLAVNTNASNGTTGVLQVNGSMTNNLYYTQNVSGLPIYNLNNSWITTGSYIPLTSINPVMTSTTAINIPKPVLAIGRPSQSFNCFPSSFVFNHSKTVNTVGSDCRLDLNCDYVESTGATSMYPTIMSFGSNGRVGIGITTPTVSLDVVGAINSSGAMTSPTITTLGTSVNVLTNQTATFLGSSFSHLLTDTNTVLPSTYTSSSLNSVGTLTSLSVSGVINCNNVAGTGLKVKHQNTTSSVILGMANTSDGQLISSNDLYFYGGGGAQVLRMTSAGQALFSNSLVIGTSSVVGKTGMDGQNYKFMVGSDNTSVSNPDDTKVVFSSGSETKSCYLYMGTPNNQSGLYTMKTLLLAQGLSSFSRAKLHFCLNSQLDNTVATSAQLSDSLMSLNYDGALSITGVITAKSDLSVSGVFQSPLTSLIGVSINTINVQNSTLLGTSYNHLLTDTMTVLPNSYGTATLSKNIVNDNLLLSSSASNTSYIQFQDLSNTGASTFYVGLNTGSLRLYSATNIDFYTNTFLNAQLTASKFLISQPVNVDYSANVIPLAVSASYASFTFPVIQMNTNVVAGTACTYLSGKANNVETFKVFNNGNVQNTNNSYGSLSDISLKTNIEKVRDYTSDFEKINFINYQLKNGESGERFIGVIAQEIQKIFPSLIDTDSDGILGVKYSVLNVICCSVVQKMLERLDKLEKFVGSEKDLK